MGPSHEKVLQKPKECILASKLSQTVYQSEEVCVVKVEKNRKDGEGIS